jgi:hypothetical protein
MPIFPCRTSHSQYSAVHLNGNYIYQFTPEDSDDEYDSEYDSELDDYDELIGSDEDDVLDEAESKG